MKEIVNVLWTGGLDSTYLVVKLLYMGMTVQPYYIIDEGRKSLKKELNAIRKISQHLQDHNVIKGQLLTTIIIYEKSINAYKDITDSWKRLNKKYSLGRQYDWLARFSRQQRKKLMVGVMMENRGKVIHTLEGKEMQKIKVSGIDVFTITNEISDMNHDAFIMYENLLFPCLLVGKKKTEEWEELHQLGFGDIAEMTWFCHHPILGLTCGHCNPCQDALNEGMAFRVSKIGYILGAIGHSVLNLFKKLRK
ncbi:MAG: hypothetical protein K6G08_06560 [Prevotella sp.]|nr:hypothetical protein [Prevotella sp.]